MTTPASSTVARSLWAPSACSDPSVTSVPLAASGSSTHHLRACVRVSEPYLGSQTHNCRRASPSHASPSRGSRAQRPPPAVAVSASSSSRCPSYAGPTVASSYRAGHDGPLISFSSPRAPAESAAVTGPTFQRVVRHIDVVPEDVQAPCAFRVVRADRDAPAFASTTASRGVCLEGAHVNVVVAVAIKAAWD